MYWQPESECMERKELEQLQLERLESTLNRVYRNVPFYRRKFDEAGFNPDELTTFFFHEHGLNFPEDGIYLLEERFLKDPELCRSFVNASIEGWEQAFLHPEETVEMVMKNLKREYIPATRVHQKWMLERMKDLMLSQDAAAPTGRLLPEDYERVARGLHTNGLIGEIPDFTTLYRKCVDDDSN